MSKASIKVEYLAETDIKEAALDARELAIKLDLAYVLFNFNGKECSISQRAEVDEVLEQYYGESRSIIS